jgi:hypothetical protein
LNSFSNLIFLPQRSRQKYVDAFSGQHTRVLDRAECRNAELAELLPGSV